jgi:hypothetical protein
MLATMKNLHLVPNFVLKSILGRCPCQGIIPLKPWANKEGNLEEKQNFLQLQEGSVLEPKSQQVKLQHRKQKYFAMAINFAMKHFFSKTWRACSVGEEDDAIPFRW